MVKKGKIRRIVAALMAGTMIFSCSACKNTKAEPEKRDDVTAIVSDEEDLKDGVKFDVTVDTTENEDEVAVVYPSGDTKSYYFQFASKAPSEVFQVYDMETDAEVSNYIEMPYYLEGTVIKVFEDYAAIQKAFPYPDVPSDQNAEKTRGMVIRVDNTDVFVLDTSNSMVAAYKEAYADDLVELKAYKAIYNNLVGYKDFPTEGEFVRVYGFYAGFDNISEMPVFTYGISKLSHDSSFGRSYTKFRTDEVKQTRYKNYVDFELPASWSGPMESADMHYYYYDAGYIIWDVFDTDDRSLSELVDEVYSEWDWDDPSMRVISNEYVPIAEGNTDAHWLKYVYIGEGTEYHDEMILFIHKNKLIMIRYYDYGITDDSMVGLEDFYKIIDSIKLRGA